MNQNFDSVLPVDSILPHVKAGHAAQVFQALAQAAGRDLGVDDKHIMLRLEEQERRSPSGVGRGVAIPHVRMRRLERPYTMLAHLARPVEFQSVDGLPVDIVFLLLSPAADVAGHLRRLSRVSRLMREPEFLARLRSAEGEDALRILFDAGDKSAARAA